MANGYTYYEDEFLRLHSRLTDILGVTTTNRLIERAVIEASEAHTSLRSLACDEETLNFDGVRASLADATPEEVRDPFMALNGVLMLLLARLLGRAVAQRLTEGTLVGSMAVPGG